MNNITLSEREDGKVDITINGTSYRGYESMEQVEKIISLLCDGKDSKYFIPAPPVKMTSPWFTGPRRRTSV